MSTVQLALQSSWHFVLRLRQQVTGWGAWKYHLAFLGFTFFVAGRHVFTKYSLQTLDTLNLTFGTAFFAMSFALAARLTFIGTGFGYQPRRLWPYMLALGLGTLIAMFGTNQSLRYLPPTLQSLIEVSVYPLMVSVVAALVGKGEKIRWGVILPVLAAASLGLGLFSSQQIRTEGLTPSLVGIGWTLVGISGWAVSIVMVANIVRSGAPIVDVIAVRFIVACAVLGAYLLATGRLDFGTSAWRLLVLAFFGYFLAFILSFAGVRHLSVVTFAVYTMLNPLTTYALSVLFLGQGWLRPEQILGAGLIFSAVGWRVRQEIRLAQERETLTRQIRRLEG
jgi:drug/metabolite transporter (DMT)-like permease